MRYLQKYKVFESLIPKEVNIDDIRDICLDITDGDRLSASVNTSNNTSYVLISIPNRVDYDGFSFGEVKDVVLRLKQFLDNHYGGCSALIVGDFSRTVFDLNSDESIERLSKLYDGTENDSSISNLAIWIS